MPAKTFSAITEEIPKQFQSSFGNLTPHMGLDETHMGLETVQFSK